MISGTSVFEISKNIVKATAGKRILQCFNDRIASLPYGGFIFFIRNGRIVNNGSTCIFFDQSIIWSNIKII
jgi:hypothetical protein